ncbi:hypothetical protein LINGRAHAP2_LOCUS31794 [Linum grandiflorum]
MLLFTTTFSATCNNLASLDIWVLFILLYHREPEDIEVGNLSFRLLFNQSAIFKSELEDAASGKDV